LFKHFEASNVFCENSYILDVPWIFHDVDLYFTVVSWSVITTHKLTPAERDIWLHPDSHKPAKHYS